MEYLMTIIWLLSTRIADIKKIIIIKKTIVIILVITIRTAVVTTTATVTMAVVAVTMDIIINAHTKRKLIIGNTKALMVMKDNLDRKIGEVGIGVVTIEGKSIIMMVTENIMNRLKVVAAEENLITTNIRNILVVVMYTHTVMVVAVAIVVEEVMT